MKTSRFQSHLSRGLEVRRSNGPFSSCCRYRGIYEAYEKVVSVAPSCRLRPLRPYHMENSMYVALLTQDAALSDQVMRIKHADIN